MPDNPETKGTRDRSRVSADQPYEVEYIHKQFPWFTHQEIIEAIRSNGPDRETILNYLSSKSDKAKSRED